MPNRTSSPGSGQRASPKHGRTQPRLWTPPLRTLNRKTTRGYEIIDFADMIGEPLLPWQKWAVIHAFERKRDGSYRFRNVNGDEYFIASGCRYAIKAANRRAGRGGSNDEVNIDELREQTDWRAWAAVSKTTMARGNGQVWGMSNAGDDESVVLNQLRDAALARHDDSLCILEWSAEDGCELDDQRAWAQANPGLGYIISESAIRSALTDPPEIFRTEVLCQRVAHLDSAIDAAAWKDCADPGATMDGLRDRTAACFDVAEDGQHATLAVAARLSHGPDHRPKLPRTLPRAPHPTPRPPVPPPRRPPPRRPRRRRHQTTRRRRLAIHPPPPRPRRRRLRSSWRHPSRAHHPRTATRPHPHHQLAARHICHAQSPRHMWRAGR